ncbi:MAG TPA: glycosyltransferase family 2 protein [Anaerolineales bacterium]|nr:glycosyltransferase family 2 protein [Anaerolineales bacterium]
MSGVGWTLVLLVSAGYAVLIILALRFEGLSNSTQDTCPAGENPPRVSVIIACRGQDIHLRDNLISILDQDYPSHEVILVASSRHDACLPLLNELTGLYPTVGRAMISTPSTHRGDKVNNLLAGIRQMDETSQILAVVDSDGRVRPEFLSRLVAPILKNEAVATTGYRWLHPEEFNPVAVLHVFWSALSLAIQSAGSFTHPWGGAMAIRMDIFERLKVADVWESALSDDNTLGKVLKQARMTVRFVPSSIVVSHPASDWGEFFTWGTRQFFLLRVCFPWEWFELLLWIGILVLGPVSLLSSSGFEASSWVAGGLALSRTILFPCVLWAIAVQVAVTCGERLARRSGHPPASVPRRYLPYALIVPIVVLGQLVASGFGRRIAWRGAVYEVGGCTKTRVVDRDGTARN